MCRIDLQKVHVEKLISLLNPPASATSSSHGFISPFASPASPGADPRRSEVISNWRSAAALRRNNTEALPSVSDRMSRLHLQDAAARTNQALDPGSCILVSDD